MCPRWLAAAFGLIALAGCGGQSPSSRTSPQAAAAPAVADPPRVEHPEFAHWSRFAVGTTVVRVKEVTNEAGSVKVTTTLRLAERTEAKVVVESQVAVERSGQPPEQNPAQRHDYPATFSLPRGMQPAQFSLPSLKAKLVGEETRQAMGREFSAQLFTWKEVNEAGPMTIKLWRADEIPGRLLRQEVSGRTQTSTEEVVEVRE